MAGEKIDWFIQAKQVFNTPKPAHFTNYQHCQECFDHNQTLLAFNNDTIGIEQLGNPGWDPICFCTAEGKRYYLPAMVRLSLETIDNDFYFEQCLFHLESDGKGNDLYKLCNQTQRQFIASFIEFFIVEHAQLLADNFCDNDALRTHEVWSSTVNS